MLPFKKRLDRRISQALTRLSEKGLLTRIKTEKGNTISLTQKGEHLARLLAQKNALHIRKPKRWDGKWRIVIFDLWERRRGARDHLRTMLQKNGFVKIQNSVWVYPYDCEELFVFLRTEFHLGKGMLYIVADEIEYDQKLQQHFGVHKN